ncbi:MAG: zinc dependent phospholipase C family protein, partial [Humidesulfovibrio sp.]|nr:zinc dependent phospholipase C family protein [Humidesulfovibrio sp.]
MPRELVHWMVAERAAGLLDSGPYGPALRQCPNGLRYGAVFHDVLFYLRGEHPEALKALPQRLHGSHAEDTYDLLRRYAPHMYSMRSMALPTAFFVGLVAHIFTDATIHPLVYHFTGNYYDEDPVRRTKAVRRHRTLETLLDMVAAGGPEAVEKTSLREVVNGVEGPLSLACPPELLGNMAGVDAMAAAKSFSDALDTFCSVQALARMPTLARWLREFEAWLPAKGRELAALFYAPQL